MAQTTCAALHAEPNTSKPRLFFSIVPCPQSNLKELAERLQIYTPPSENEIYLIF